ncbi:hypothetical protein DPEC_G00371200, partial [Dallia pectoralis]
MINGTLLLPLSPALSRLALSCVRVFMRERYSAFGQRSICCLILLFANFFLRT